MKYKTIHVLVIFITILFAINLESKPKIAFTFDDPNTLDTPLMTWQQRNGNILTTLNKYHIKVALFVCGKRVVDENGIMLLNTWDNYGHLICNHSFSHLYYNSPKAVAEIFWADVLKGDSIIRDYKNYSKFFRFPFLKEGTDKNNRNYIRKKMKSIGYKVGYVSIDASDWYIDAEMTKVLSIDPKIDLTPYKEYLLKHLLNRAIFYNDLAVKLTGREINHTILLHHSLLNALFLDDILAMFKKNGWELVDVDKAYQDEFYQTPPNIVPAGESIIWAKAKQTGRYEDILRYPAEDSEYEKDSLSNYIEQYNRIKTK
ncbi:MAG: polysaccharide deacetylase family protein [bacterium]